MAYYSGEYLKGDDRYYLDENNLDYLSVTSFLSKYEDKSSLLKWKNKIGEEAANLVSSSSIVRGKSVHSYIENYLENSTDFKSDNILPEYLPYLRLALNDFYSHINPIAIEDTIFYKDENVRYAGRYDSLVEIPSNTFISRTTGEYISAGLALVDLKTKNKPVRFDIADYIIKYALQGVAYVKALNFQDIKYIVIVTVTNKKSTILRFCKHHIEFYWSKFLVLLNHWYINKGNELEDFSRNKLWYEIIKEANCSYDKFSGDFVNFLPDEIKHV